MSLYSQLPPGFRLKAIGEFEQLVFEVIDRKAPVVQRRFFASGSTDRRGPNPCARRCRSSGPPPPCRSHRACRHPGGSLPPAFPARDWLKNCASIWHAQRRLRPLRSSRDPIKCLVPFLLQGVMPVTAAASSFRPIRNHAEGRLRREPVRFHPPAREYAWHCGKRGGYARDHANRHHLAQHAESEFRPVPQKAQKSPHAFAIPQFDKTAF